MLLSRAVEVNAFVQEELRRFTQCRWIEHPTFQLRGGRSVTEPRSPQRYLFRQCLVVMWCYDVPLGHYWRTNHSRKRIYLALTIYRDFMQSLFLSGFERGGAIRINRDNWNPHVCLSVVECHLFPSFKRLLTGIALSGEEGVVTGAQLLPR